MATSSSIYTLLQFYANKQRSPLVERGEFVEYLRRYASHHAQENPELEVYARGPADALQEELLRLGADRLVALVNPGGGKQFICVTGFFIERYTETYRELEHNFALPFPSADTLPKSIPADILTKQSASDALYRLLDQTEPDDGILYCVLFSKGVPALLLPSTVSAHTVIGIALKKLQDLLRKNESHDYFLKKLTISNPGKELSIKNFFTQLVAKPEEAWAAFKLNGETFYYWNQLCYFIRQDYNKLKDFTAEDVNILQSIGIIEVGASYYKAKISERAARDAAFRQMEEQLLQPPYYFSMDDIVKMKDKNGAYLMLKYSEKELKARLADLTAETIGDNLPLLLVFKAEDRDRYFIYREKVMPLIVRLCNDARLLIRESLGKIWFRRLLEFETLPEMKEAPAFEKCLDRELQSCSPVLYGLLHASFLPILAFDELTPGKIPLYRDGKLLPYSELLLVSRQEIFADAKAKLPVWYTLPIISWVLSLIVRRSKRRKKDEQPSATSQVIAEERAAADQRQGALDARDSLDPKQNRKRDLRHAASKVENRLVPQNSTINRELDSYMEEWNDRLNQQAHDELVEDINGLIRDYVRKTLRTLKPSDLTADRITSLADSLSAAPALIKIKNQPALKRYIELYMVKLIKNLP